MKTTSVTLFGKTKNIPLVVYYNGKQVDSDEWDEDFYICRPEEWYGLSASNFKNKYVRVITVQAWERASKR